MSDGRLAYRLKTPWRDGTTRVVMKRRELLERLAPLIPPPRAHQVRYHGVLAPCASGRDRVVPAGGGDSVRAEPVRQAESAPSQGEGSSIGDRAVDRSDDQGGESEALVARVPSELRAEGQGSLARRVAWANLLKRVFEVDALRCPECGERMRLIAAITQPDVARRILECLVLPPRAPPLGRASVIDRGIDRAFAMDPFRSDQALVDAQPDSGFEFDQTPIELRSSEEDV